MAGQTAGNLDDRRDAFNEAQLDALDGISGRQPAEVLQAAEDIKLIDKDTKEAIQTTLLPNHVLLFQKALAADKSGDRKKAFKHAFSSVYGKFLLEHKGSALENPDGPVMQTLEKVLKFPIDKKIGLKGRSELIAALRRLERVEDETRYHARAGTPAAPKNSIAYKSAKKIDEEISEEIQAAEIGVLEETDKRDAAPAGSDTRKKAEERIVELEARIGILYGRKADPVKYVMEEAFGKPLNPAEMKTLERVHTDATSKKATLDDHYKTLTGDTAKDVHAKFVVLEKSTVTAKGAREAEAKATDNKTKLVELKELFSEGKVAALIDLINRLDAVGPEYREARDNKNLEKDITEKNTEATLLEQEIAAYRKSKDKTLIAEIDKKSGPLKTAKAEAKRLEVLKSKLEEARKLARELRTELQKYCRAYIDAAELGITFTPNFVTRIKTAKDNLDKVNVEDDFRENDFKDVYNLLNPGFAKAHKEIKRTLEDTELGLAAKQEHENAKTKMEKAKAFHADLKPLVERIGKSADLGVLFADDEATSETFISGMKREFVAIKVEDMGFDVTTLINFYNKYFKNFFETTTSREALAKKFETGIGKTEDEIKKADRNLHHAKEAAEKSKNLTDAQAAKKIVGVLVGAQFPDMNETDKAKLAGLVLAGDVAKLQTEEGYEALANRGGAELFDTVGEVGLRGKLIAFQYKEGDKVVQPFKGMKPEDFKDWANIEKLFNIEKLNHKNGFFLLAALETFDKMKDESGNIRSVQALRVEEKLKALLAKQLGVHERMDEAGISKIIDEAFKEQMKKVRPLVKAHFDNYGEKGDEVKNHKVELLNLKYKELTDKLRNKKINQEIYEVKLKALIKEAVEADVDGQVEFSQDSVAAGYWHSSEAQWVRDKAHDVGAFLGKKAAAVGLGAPALIGLKGVWGATKLGASLGFHTVLFPFRAARYPLIALAKPGIWAINLFRKTPWQPLPTIRQALSNDVSRITGYATTKASETVQGATKAVTETPASMWKKVGWKSTKYAERSKDESELRTEEMKVLEEKAALTPVEVASSPFIDLAEYKDKIKALNEMVGAKTGFPAEHDVKVGHTEKAAEKKEEAHEKKDDHGHDKKAAGHHS